MKKERYIKPKIKEKRIKPSHFLMTRRGRSINQEEGFLLADVPR